jgi:small ligand-binding sensory domain FIST
MESEQSMPTACAAWSELVLGAFDESKVQGAAERARKHIGGKSAIAFVFVSADYENSLREVIEIVQIHARCPRVVGCSAGGLIGMGREEEGASGFSIMVLSAPNAEVLTVQLPQDSEGSREWRQASKWNSDGCTGWILLGNPGQLGENWIKEWNAMMGHTPTFGGLASGSQSVSDLFIFTEAGMCEAAAIAVGFRGGVKLKGLVSQGCTPIGEPFTITKADENVVYKLASKNAYDQLQSTFQSLPGPTRERAQGNILVGLAMSEYVEDFRSGDFLIRSILGGDPNLGALSVGALPRVGQTLQFQLRDSEAADAELREMLMQKRIELTSKPFASLLFTCGGRGQHLFGKPNHDAALFDEAFPLTPISGLFCNGEIGTVGDKAYLHGFTASGVFFVQE